MDNNISFNGLKLTVNKGKITKAYGGNFDLRPAYPMDSAIFKHDSPALFAQYVQHFNLTDVQINWGNNLASFFTNGIEVDYYDDLSVQNSIISPAPHSKNAYAIKLSNGSNTNIFNCRTLTGFQLIKKDKAN